jgi:hypothetical protein
MLSCSSLERCTTIRPLPPLQLASSRFLGSLRRCVSGPPSRKQADSGSVARAAQQTSHSFPLNAKAPCRMPVGLPGVQGRASPPGAATSHTTAMVLHRGCLTYRTVGCLIAAPGDGGGRSSVKCAALLKTTHIQPPPPQPSDMAGDSAAEELHTLGHALNDLLEWEGTHQLKLLYHSSDDRLFRIRNILGLFSMYRSVVQKGPTVTVFQYSGDGGKMVGVYLEKDWLYIGSHIHVSDLIPPATIVRMWMSCHSIVCDSHWQEHGSLPPYVQMLNLSSTHTHASCNLFVSQAYPSIPEHTALVINPRQASGPHHHLHRLHRDQTTASHAQHLYSLQLRARDHASLQHPTIWS